MPNIETTEELAEHIADLCNIYNQNPEDDHNENCNCRMCFVAYIRARIKQSVKNDNLLSIED